VTRLEVGRQGFNSPAEELDFFSMPPRPDRFWRPPVLSYGYRCFFPRG
jgi:hypothetical protein